MTDRWAFKPVAILLLVPVIVITSALTAIVIAPPLIGAGMSFKELDRRLEEAGADFTQIPTFPQRTTIYANDGETVLARVYLDNRELVRLREISKPARTAVLAIEDSEFYEHGAVNIVSTLRALAANLSADDIVQGGSTITQQLVKNTTPGLDPFDKSFERKFQEAAIALRVEREYTKNQILEMYLNYVYFGNNVYGIGTASEFYFHKPASELTLTEGALLAGMIRAPAYYDPLERPAKAKLRRDDVLNRMIGLGPDWLRPRRGEILKKRPLGLPKDVGELRLPTPPFLVNYVKAQIVEDPNGWYTSMGATPKDRETTLKEGGLDIVTTLDPEWQDAAQAAGNLPWARTPSNPDHTTPAGGGVGPVEAKTGADEAMGAANHFKDEQHDTEATPNQPGSSFKPYILAAAFEQGIPPSATYSGAQGVVDPERCLNNGAPWIVYNAEGSSRGMLDLYQATADSVNGVFARLILDAGLENTVEMAHRMGVKSPLPPFCSLATGSVGISPLDQASGYQTLANEGVHCEPYAVSEVRQGDQVIYQHEPDCERVLDRAIANLITSLLAGVVQHGTAGGIFTTYNGWGSWPVVGKTGTADQGTNVWFAGYTRQVTTAVWVGSQGRPFPLSEFFGQNVYGSSVAAPIWKAFMAKVMVGFQPLEFPEPELKAVPSVVGLSEEQAKALLKAGGWQMRSEIIGSYLPAGTVAAQNPGGGTMTIPKALVTIYVSNGIPPVTPVPKVYYLTLEEATAILEAANFFVEIVEEQVEDPEKIGTVLHQSPKSGTPAKEGTTVTLYVGVEKPPPEEEEEGGGGGNNGGGNNGGGNGGGGGN